MDTITATVTTAPAQVGNGRTVHQVDSAEFTADTLCGRTVARVLTPAQAETMGKHCTRCAKIAETPAVEESAPETAAPETVEAPAAPKGWEHGHCTTMGRGKVHEVSTWTEGGVQPLCRTGSMSSRGTQYRMVEGELTCATCIANRDRRDAAAETPAVEEARVEAPEAEAPAAAEEVTEVDDVQPAAADLVHPEESAQVTATPEVDETETVTADLVRMSAYTAAGQPLHINGTDNPDQVLTLEAGAVTETVAAMRRMPRWNAAEDRFTVNKVALIIAGGTDGDRVWVRGEAAPFRVDIAGNPVAEDAPAERGQVDRAAVLAATRVLRRRKEVQRVIDNRTNARAASTPAPAPVVEEPAPAPVVEEAPAAPQAPAYGAPEWRTLKGVEGPFQLYGTRSGKWFRTAGDRKRCTGDALDVVRTWCAHSSRWVEDADGNTFDIGGLATRCWIAVTA